MESHEVSDRDAARAELAALQSQRAALERDDQSRDDLEEARIRLAEAEERLEQARAEAEAAEQAKAAAEQRAEEIRVAGQIALARAREAVQQAEGHRARLTAEADALADLLKAGTDEAFPPLIDALTVEPGFEQALAAALGDDLTASVDEAAPIHWRLMPDLPDAPALPPGATPLAGHVTAPKELARRLAQIGVVADAIAGDKAAPLLKPGQMVVTKLGGAWRWDGLTVQAGAPTAAALRLKQRNRLSELREELRAADDRLAQARALFEEARSDADTRNREARLAVDQAATRDRQAREAVRTAFGASGQARDMVARLGQAAAAAASRLQALIETAARLETDLQDTNEAWTEARAALAELPDAAEGRTRVAELRARLAESRGRLADRQNGLDRLLREAEARHRRLEAIIQEEQSWRRRLDGTGGRLTELEERAAETRDEMEMLAARPAAIEEERIHLLDRIAEAERIRKRAADDLARLETELAEVERGLKISEGQLADAREARAHAEAAVTAARHALDGLRERIAERLDCPPEKVLDTAGIEPDGELPDTTAVETRLERLLTERENMGPVNLRAEQEVAELEARIDTMRTEREDLVAAIARLRQGISSLNREARERLLASFEKVDAHFQDLFTRLFGGGKAHLALTEAEDPLDAGLEIYASPPGKKLQVLSLLSGGEQALTALALLFAVFLCNPAPICVLDEVDAPLDEANVGRFCDMVEEMARGGHTRFLIITHHRLTMARMDRLFGVTMAERGVSQLVSVDLSMAEDLRATA